jgi:protein-glutamine gamma-glutamyltransferase
MIQLSGKPFQQNDLFLPAGMERMILKHLQEDSKVYNYETLEELGFELTLRKNIILSAKAMNQGDAQFEIFEGSRCNPQYWDLTATGGFLVKKNVKPSEAVSDIFSNSSKYAFECATAKVIIYYYAILLTAGENIFNQFFQNLYLYSWHFDSDLVMQSIHTEHFIPGDVVYFKNPDYNPETFWWRGENAVVIGDGTYFGHGLGIKTAEQIIEFLNETRKPGSIRSAYLTDYVARPSFQHLAELFLQQRNNCSIKRHHIVINHNKTSISCDRYLFYLYSLYKNII